MNKHELLNLEFEELIKAISGENFLTKKIDGVTIFNLLLKKLNENQIIDVIKNDLNILNLKDENETLYLEKIIDLNYTNLLNEYGQYINLSKIEYQGNRNMLGYLASKGMFNIIDKALEKQKDILNQKDPYGCVGTERLIDANAEELLNKYAENINLNKIKYQGNKNMLGYLASKGMFNVIDKVLEKQPTILNEKDPSGVIGTERLVDANAEELLNKYAENINLNKSEYQGNRNMLGYLAAKRMFSVIDKALDLQKDILNQKDAYGCLGTERLIEANAEELLNKYAESINLNKIKYQGDKNMLGYLASKGMFNVIDKALEKQPTILNEKDPSGVIGTERLVDANAEELLNKYAENINLNKSEYQGNKNMLGYLASKGMFSIIDKALEKQPTILNEKDPSGVIGTERLIDAKADKILINYIKNISLSKTNAQGNKNMLGYLATKKMTNVIEECFLSNNEIKDVLNKKDISGITGVERLFDSGYCYLFSKHKSLVDWSGKFYNEKTNFEKIIPTLGDLSTDVAIYAILSNNIVLKNNLKYVIENKIDLLSFTEIAELINKNTKINDINILTFLSQRGHEKYIEYIITPEKGFIHNVNLKEETTTKFIENHKKDLMVEETEIEKMLKKSKMIDIEQKDNLEKVVVIDKKPTHEEIKKKLKSLF